MLPSSNAPCPPQTLLTCCRLCVVVFCNRNGGLPLGSVVMIATNHYDDLVLALSFFAEFSLFPSADLVLLSISTLALLWWQALAMLLPWPAVLTMLLVLFSLVQPSISLVDVDGGEYRFALKSIAEPVWSWSSLDSFKQESDVRNYWNGFTTASVYITPAAYAQRFMNGRTDGVAYDVKIAGIDLIANAITVSQASRCYVRHDVGQIESSKVFNLVIRAIGFGYQPMKQLTGR